MPPARPTTEPTERSIWAVMMTININDDNVTSDVVENLPVVRRRSVITQAMVEEGKSVLLAGYSSEERINTMTGIPVLSSIPVVGKLFKYDSKKTSNLDRFYLRSTGIPHAIQTLWTYDVPVGRGKKYGANMNGWLDGAIGGWTFSGTARFQTQSFVVRSSETA